MAIAIENIGIRNKIQIPVIIEIGNCNGFLITLVSRGGIETFGPKSVILAEKHVYVDNAWRHDVEMAILVKVSHSNIFATEICARTNARDPGSSKSPRPIA